MKDAWRKIVSVKMSGKQVAPIKIFDGGNKPLPAFLLGSEQPHSCMLCDAGIPLRGQDTEKR